MLFTKPLVPIEKHVLRNKNPSHLNYKIYYLLEKPCTFMYIYNNSLHKNKTLRNASKTEGFNLLKAKEIVTQLKENRYDSFLLSKKKNKPKKGKKWIKPNDQLSQHGILFQEAIRKILEAIYEPEFVQFEKQTNYFCTNYGARPNKSTSNLVQRIQRDNQRTTYVLKGSFKEFYPSVNPKLLISFLKKRIKDKKFLTLIHHLLTKGIMTNYDYHHEFTRVQQVDILGPILFNIYLFQFDKYMMTLFKTVFKEGHPFNKTMTTHPPFRQKLKQKLKTDFFLSKWKHSNKKSDAFRTFFLTYKYYNKVRLTVSSQQLCTLPKIGRFYRFGDEWILFLVCLHKEAVQIKQMVYQWLKKELNFELEQKQITMTHLTKEVSFCHYRLKPVWNKTSTHLKRVYSSQENNVQFFQRTIIRHLSICADKKSILNQLVQNKFCRSSDYFPIGKPNWARLDEYGIVLNYHQLFFHFLQYYKYHNDRHTFHHMVYILKYSCAKTLALRKKISMTQIFKLYGKNLTVIKQVMGGKPKSVSFPRFD